jgi:hypothetical protein
MPAANNAKSKRTNDDGKVSPKQQAQQAGQQAMRASVRQPKQQQQMEKVNFLPSPDDPDFLSIFRRIQDATQRDPNGFLTAVYDPQHIPPDIESRPPDKRAKILQAAMTPLSMLEGYLSLPSSKPVWTPLPGEPKAYFEAFRCFLLSPQRSLAQSGNDIDFEVPGFTPYTVREAHTLFYWADRSKAYDILKPVAAARLRDQRLLLAEDAHYLLTQRLMEQFSSEIEFRAKDSLDENGQGDERPWAGLKPNEIVSGIASMMQMQRVALGLPSHGPKLKNEGWSPTPHGGIDRNVRESAQNYLGTQDTGLTLAQKMRQDIDRTLAEDPAAAATLQAAAMEILLKARASTMIENSAPNQGHGQPQGYGPPPNVKE